MINKKRKLRILITLESYPPEITGSGIATKRLAEGLSARGHHVEVICPGSSIRYKKNVEGRVTVHRVNSIPIPFYKEFRCSFFPFFIINKIFGGVRPDILHIADHLFISRAAYRAARKNHIRAVGTNHFTPYNWIPNLGVKDKPLIRRIVEKILWTHFAILFSKIDIITTPTEIARNIIQRIVSNKEAQVISNGIDLKMFSNIKPEMEELKKYAIDPKNTILLSSSRLDKEKRVDLIIDALVLIKDLVPFQMIITGTGKEEKDLKARAVKGGLADRIIFTGTVPEDTLFAFFKISDIFVTASEVELQGLSIMEAMTAGLPVVAAKSMAIPELVIDGKNGYLFEPGDAVQASRRILKLIQNKSLRKKMSGHSMEIIKDHDFEKTLDRFENIYYENIGD